MRMRFGKEPYYRVKIKSKVQANRQKLLSIGNMINDRETKRRYIYIYIYGEQLEAAALLTHELKEFRGSGMYSHDNASRRISTYNAGTSHARFRFTRMIVIH